MAKSESYFKKNHKLDNVYTALGFNKKELDNVKDIITAFTQKTPIPKCKSDAVEKMFEHMLSTPFFKGLNAKDKLYFSYMFGHFTVDFLLKENQEGGISDLLSKLLGIKGSAGSSLKGALIAADSSDLKSIMDKVHSKIMSDMSDKDIFEKKTTKMDLFDDNIFKKITPSKYKDRLDKIESIDFEEFEAEIIKSIHKKSAISLKMIPPEIIISFVENTMEGCPDCDVRTDCNIITIYDEITKKRKTRKK